MMRFVLASHNRGKLKEMQEILGELGVEVVLQSDVGLDLEPEEIHREVIASSVGALLERIARERGLDAAAMKADFARRTAACAWTP